MLDHFQTLLCQRTKADTLKCSPNQNSQSCIFRGEKKAKSDSSKDSFIPKRGYQNNSRSDRHTQRYGSNMELRIEVHKLNLLPFLNPPLCIHHPSTALRACNSGLQTPKSRGWTRACCIMIAACVTLYHHRRLPRLPRVRERERERGTTLSAC